MQTDSTDLTNPSSATGHAGCRHPRPDTVERVSEARLPTEVGEFRIVGYRSLISSEEFVALVKGELRVDRQSLVRIHSQCMTGDVFGSLKCDCGRQLHAAMELIEAEGHGAIVYQQQEGRGTLSRQARCRTRRAVPRRTQCVSNRV